MMHIAHMRVNCYTNQPTHDGAYWQQGFNVVAWARADAFSLRPMSGEVERRKRFGYALLRAMRERDMSERELAKRLGIDPRRIAAYRKGKALPDYYEFQGILRELRVSERLFVDLPEVPAEPYYPIEKYLLEAVESGAEEGLRRLRNPGPEVPDPPARSPGRPVRAK